MGTNDKNENTNNHHRTQTKTQKKQANEMGESGSTTRRRRGGWVDPSTLPRGPNGRALCRWCQTEVAPPRRSFCSDACVHEHRLRTNNRYMRCAVYKRDRAVCATCGVDTAATARAYWEAAATGDLDAGARVLAAAGIGALGRRRIMRRGRLGGNLFDVDHIVAVHDGGGECGMDNLQTLCIPCHRKRTKQQRATWGRRRDESVTEAEEERRQQAVET